MQLQEASSLADQPKKPRWWQAHRQLLLVTLCVTVFAVLLSVPIFQQPEKQNCLALLAFVSLLWCTEAIPLFVTSILVPLLIVVLRVLVDRSADPPRRLPPQEAAPAVFHVMFSQVRLDPIYYIHCMVCGQL